MKPNFDLIKAEAKNLGFSFCGHTPIRQTPHFMNYLHALDENHFGDLSFLSQPYVVIGRRDPSSLHPSAKTAIVLGINYNTNNAKATKATNYGHISKYAIFPDYHNVLREKSQELIHAIEKLTGQDLPGRIFVDSGPVMEKDFAAMTGAGSVGKNSLFIQPETGSFLFLSVIFTNLDLDEEPYKEIDLCGDCNLCREACPTRCIQDNRTIKVDECLSYLTIEHQGVIPINLRKKLSNHIFGCDVCQTVCPYNRGKSTLAPVFFGIQPVLGQAVDIAGSLVMNEKLFVQKYKNTVIHRLGLIRFLRNCLIAAGNIRDLSFLPLIVNYIKHCDPLLRAHAVWSFSQYNTKDVRDILEKHQKIEKSALVIEEISFALQAID